MPSAYSHFSSLCQERCFVLFVQRRMWEPLRNPMSSLPEWSWDVERLSALSSELQLSQARPTSGLHPPTVLTESCVLWAPQVGPPPPAVLGQASAGVRCPPSQPVVGGRWRGAVTLIHNSCVQLHVPGRGAVRPQIGRRQPRSAPPLAAPG